MNKGMKLLSMYSAFLIILFLGFVLIKIVCKVQAFANIDMMYTIYGLSILGIFALASILVLINGKKIKFNRRY